MDRANSNIEKLNSGLNCDFQIYDDDDLQEVLELVSDANVHDQEVSSCPTPCLLPGCCFKAYVLMPFCTKLCTICCSCCAFKQLLRYLAFVVY